MVIAIVIILVIVIVSVTVYRSNSKRTKRALMGVRFSSVFFGEFVQHCALTTRNNVFGLLEVKCGKKHKTPNNPIFAGSGR